MIEFKLGTSKEILDVLKIIKDQPISAKIAYRIARLGCEVEKEYASYEEARAALIKKYCVKDENGNPKVNENGNVWVDNTSENFTKALQELTELDNEIVKIEVDKFTLEDLSEVKISPEQMIKLMNVIEE